MHFRALLFNFSARRSVQLCLEVVNRTLAHDQTADCQNLPAAPLAPVGNIELPRWRRMLVRTRPARARRVDAGDVGFGSVRDPGDDREVELLAALPVATMFTIFILSPTLFRLQRSVVLTWRVAP